MFGEEGKLAIEEFREDRGMLADWFRRLEEFLALLEDSCSYITDGR